MNVIPDDNSPRPSAEASPARRITTALGLLVLRIVLGAVFIAHGAQKIFADGIGATTEGFTGMGIPLPSVTAPLVAYTELIGGILLVLGVLTRIAALGTAIVAISALFLVHLPNGFFAAANGYELVLILGAASAAVMLTGAGAVSVDALFVSRRRGG